MKKNVWSPGLEFVFAMGIIVCIIIPRIVMAKNHNAFKVTIMNGDTVINGQSIKNLSATDRAAFLKDIKLLEGVLSR